MNSVIDRIDRAIDMTAAIVKGLTVDHLAAPTPCPGWDVRTELNHPVGGMHIFAAELTGTDPGGEHEDDWLGTDAQAAFADAVRLDRAAWHRPGALETTVRLGFGTVPGPMGRTHPSHRGPGARRGPGDRHRPAEARRRAGLRCTAHHHARHGLRRLPPPRNVRPRTPPARRRTRTPAAAGLPRPRPPPAPGCVTRRRTPGRRARVVNRSAPVVNDSGTVAGDARIVDVTSCPDCGSAAEVQWRAVLESTHGPVEHAKVFCVQRHWFLLPTALLPNASSDEEAGDRA